MPEQLPIALITPLALFGWSLLVAGAFFMVPAIGCGWALFSDREVSWIDRYLRPFRIFTAPLPERAARNRDAILRYGAWALALWAVGAPIVFWTRSLLQSR